MSSLIKVLKNNKLGRSLLSVILAAAVLCSTLSMVTLIPATAESIWDGSYDTAPTDSDSDGVYEITNGTELAYVIKNGGGANAKYILKEDIYLNDTTKVDWLTGTVADGYSVNTWFGDWQVTAFQGTIDGNGHTIHGLYYEKDPAKEYTNYYGGVGLFSKVANLTLKNLAVDNSYIHQEASVSAFVAATDVDGSVTMDSCYVGKNVYLKGGAAGALTGYAYKATNGTITNCYSLATLNGVNFSGLVAFNWYNNVGDLYVANCYNANGAVSTHSDTSYYATTMENNYETVNSAFDKGNVLRTADNMQGPDALTSPSKMPNLNRDGKFEATDTYPILKVFKPQSGGETPTVEVWDGVTLTAPTDSDNDGVYEIANGAQLAWAISNGQSGENYKLTADIYLNDVTKINWETGVADAGYTPNTWLTGASFGANLDGDGYNVYGIYYNEGLQTSEMAEGWAKPAGLIPSVTNGATVNITKVGVDYMFINTKHIASAFVGAAGASNATAPEDKTTIYIDQCYVGANVDVTAYAAGVFRGYSRNNAISIKNSYNLGKFRSNADKSPEIDNNTYDYRFSWFIGNGWGLDLIAVENCYNATGALYKGSWPELNAKFKNNYAAGLTQDKDGDGVAETVWYNTSGETPLTTAQMQGTGVFTTATQMPMLNSTGVYEATNGYPILTVFKKSSTPENPEGPSLPDGVTVWDGQVATTLTGSGTETDPYIISNGAELAYAITSGGADQFYKLTADIYLNDITKIDWQTGVANTGYEPKAWFNNTAFSGTIDGDGHVVYGLYYTTADAAAWGCEGIGLIPRVNLGKTVKVTGLGIENAYVIGKNGVSAIVGFAGSETNGANEDDVRANRANVIIDQCYVGATVTLTGNAVGAFRGGTFGSNTTITNSYSLATLNTNGTAGLIGNHWNVTVAIENCYNANGAITSDVWNVEIDAGFKNVYATDKGAYVDKVVELTPDNMKGDTVFTDITKMPNLNNGNAYVAKANDYPVLKVFTDDQGGGTGGGTPTPPPAPPVVVPDYVWDGVTMTAPVDSNNDGVYEITNGAELAYVIDNDGKINGVPACKFILTADIYLNDIDHINWQTGEADAGYTPRSWFRYWKEGSVYRHFQGTIDGDGHTIYGLYFNMTSNAAIYDAAALIPAVTGTTTIKDLAVDNAYVNYTNGVSAFVGYAEEGSYVSISNSYAGADVTLIGDYAGVFRATAKNAAGAAIENCYSLATATGANAYGLLGYNYEARFSINIANCYNANGPINNNGGPGWHCTVSNSYATEASVDKDGENALTEGVTVITADKMQGTDVFEDGKMPNLNAEEAYIAQDNNYPQLIIFTEFAPEEDNTPVPDYVWDGTTSAPTQGEGTKYKPYLISTAEELAYIIANGGDGKYYKLTADIYLNDINKVNWNTGKAKGDYEIRSWYNNIAFEGTIIGDGHRVYGLYYKSTQGADWNCTGVGLVPRVDLGKSVKITGLGVESSYLSGANGVSAFVGFAGGRTNGDSVADNYANVTIDQCYVGETVTLKGNAVGAFRGGAYGANTIITSAYSLATLSASGTKCTAGLIGNHWSVTVAIRNSYNANGAITTDVYNESIDAGLKNVYAIDSGYYTDNVIERTPENMQGLNVFTDETKMPKLNEDGAFVVTEGYPILIAFTDLAEDDDSDETETPDYVWDGTTSAPTQGDGTRKNPYLISTAEELAYVVKNGGQGKYYKLTADIYLNDINKINWTNGNPKGTYEPNVWFDNVAFEGTINGDGHVVYGLYYKTLLGEIWGYTGQGLIPRVDPGKSVSISELGVDYAYVTSPNGASAFVGFAGPKNAADAETVTDSANVSIRESYVGANVTIKGNDAGAFRGATKGATTIINNCYSLGNMIGAKTAGLIGNIWNASVAISNSFNANGAIVSDTWLQNIDDGLKNVYATDKGKYVDKVIQLTVDNMKGYDVFTNEAKMPNLNEEEAFVVTESYPILIVFSDIEVEEIVPQNPGDVWNGTVSKEFTEGEGTKENPYIISTGPELAYAIKNNGFGGKYFKLSHDIYLNDIKSSKLWYMNENSNAWFADGAGFDGHIDGNGHIVYGLWYSDDTEVTSAGLIPVFKAGSIENLGVRNAQVNAKQYAAGIVGRTVNGGEKLVKNCFVDETVYVSTKHIDSGTGGIIGMVFDGTNASTITTTVENCYSKAGLSGVTESRKNGIIGGAWRTPYSIRYCYSVGYPVYTAEGGGEATSAYWDYAPAYKVDANGDYIRDNGGYLIVDEEKFVDKVREGVELSSFIYDNYSDVGTPNQWTLLTIVDRESMSGESALTVMPKLDYVNVYQVVDGGTPKLKIFTSIDGKDISTSKDADFFGNGKGTMNDPFVITTVDQLRYLVESLDTKGKYYKLGNDIYVNNTKDANWMNNNPESWYSHEATHSFAGNFDGNGYKIYGLYVNEEPTVYLGENYKGEGKEPEWINHGTGLFPYADVSASIRNVHIRDSYLCGKGSVGGLVGNILGYEKVGRLQLIACSVDESVTLKGFTVGGLVGASHSGGVDLTYCYATANMSNTGPANRLSGMVGDIWGAKVSAFEAYTTDYQVTFGSLVNTTALYAPVDQLGVTVLQKADMIGAKAKKNMDFTWDTVWYIVDGKTPQLKVVPYGTEESLYDEGVEGRVWSGKISTEFGGGDGSEANPYLIYTPEQMARIFAVQSTEFAHYKLMADLKLNDTSKENWEDNAKMWYAGQYAFYGVFDGNGHVVSGLYYKNENNNNNAWAGLFQCISRSSTIKRLGVTESTVINKGPAVHSYAAAICAYLEHWHDRDYEDATAPVISECFADDSVYIEATAAAGILAATQTEVTIENCYFTGELTGSMYAGAMVADNWAASGRGPTIKNCYGATLDGDPLGDGYGTGSFNDDTVNDKRAFLSNCYIAGSSLTTSITPLSVMYMKGHQAKDYMPGLDYSKIWKTVEDGTPVLRCFKNADKYTSTRNPKEVVITFGNLGDAVVEPLRGYPGYTPISAEDLPVPERRGFIFNGWHHHNPMGCEFELTLFPNYDITLYANWTEVGFTQNFDKELDEKYDYNEGIEIFKPGLPNYDTKYVHSGWRSLHTLKDSPVDPEFLVSYENRLLVGYEYEISFWMTTDEEGTSGKIYFEQAEYGDVFDEIVGYQEAVNFTGLKAGEWKQYKVKIIANAPYLIVRAEKGTSLFFEDFEAIPTGAKGELGGLIGYKPGASAGNNGGLAPWAIVIIVCGAVLVLGGAAVTTIVIVKKKKA